ncbi:MAG TPA: hypothetical protein VM689_05200 [Aliidongia sp.]|nr:hypothetical protein [Aliidongia sp.]
MLPANGTILDLDAASSFGYGEHLLVWSWRRLASELDAALIGREFAGVCGEDTGEVIATFCNFLEALDFAGRRKLTVGSPGSLALSPDERLALSLLGAAQADMPALFEARLRWLARPEARPALAIATGALATALSVNGLHLARPRTDGPTMCARELATT